LDSDGTAKLSDFGLAVVNASVARSTNAPAHKKGGSIPWMAPEVFNGAKATCASDVFSMHVVMWEVLEHRTADSRSVAIGEDLLRSGEAKLSLDGADSTPTLARMQALLHRCGCLDSKQRPSMDDVAREVGQVVELAATAPRPPSASVDDVAREVSQVVELADTASRSASARMDDVARAVSQVVELADTASRPTAADDRAVLMTLLETLGGLQPSKGGSERLT
ncbi:unnamed protein product, partial [Pylaiella littoralis]